jgi:ribosome-associated protein
MASTSKRAKQTPRKRTARKRPVTPRLRLPPDVALAVDAALDKKAADMVVLDLRKASAFTDCFLICTGANLRQVQAIADSVQEALRKKGLKPSLVEGYQRGEWILVDYFDFIVHVFAPATREFYGLERLWADAVHIAIPAN